ncbi:MAG TPA: ABC transporter ATP-binding protein [Oligoflexia bacterium]|nr:ABC transporter ATP-binding protein [Oligoflexia bacterium]HMP48436.1 ABC transporter ATP-binding protein [Oligoflexia bacterium]
MKTKLEVIKLYKSYRSYWTYSKRPVLKGLSFSVKDGESFALLGANGAGKTSTMKSILGFTFPDSGEILFDGLPLKQATQRSRIAFLPEQPYFYQHLSVHETLDFYASLFGYYGKERKDKVTLAIERLNLSEKSRDRIGSLSKGLQQRVGLAQILLGDPELVILDEPFSGLDPLARVEIRNLFLSLKGEGRTIIIASHILSDIEELCDSAAILVDGVCKEYVLLRDLFNGIDSSYRLITLPDDEASLEKIEQIIGSVSATDNDSGAIKFDRYGDGWILIAENHGVGEKLLRAIISEGIPVREFSRIQRPLEELFVSANRHKPLSNVEIDK